MLEKRDVGSDGVRTGVRAAAQSWYLTACLSRPRHLGEEDFPRGPAGGRQDVQGGLSTGCKRSSWRWPHTTRGHRGTAQPAARAAAATQAKFLGQDGAVWRARAFDLFCTLRSPLTASSSPP